jgi:hypothetical protein
MPSDKNFFWHGILSLNELGAHAFFDVKIKKNVPDAPNAVRIFTSDIPPLLLTASDTLHATLLLENNVGLNTVRYCVTESQFLGTELMRAVESAAGLTTTIPSPSSSPSPLKAANGSSRSSNRRGSFGRSSWMFQWCNSANS